MRVLVVGVMHVAMFVIEGLMGVLVFMRLGQVQPDRQDPSAGRRRSVAR